MKQPPKGAIFETMTIKRVEFLQSALARLNDEVGTYFELLDKHHELSARKVGFWSSLRMLMPIIEAIAHVMDKSPQELLGNLDVQTPYLVWDLFRHSLIHGDVLQHAKYGSKEVGWGVGLNGFTHIIIDGQIGIDSRYLYSKLKEYLEAQIQLNDQQLVEIEVGVIYTNPKQEIIDDFKKL